MKKIIIVSVVVMLVSVFFGKRCFAADQISVLEGTGDSSLTNCLCGQSTQKTDTKCQQYCGSYALNDFMTLVVKISTIILKVAGSLALLSMVVGGGMFLFSAGNKSWIDRGRTAMTGAAIGLLIVFFSYVIINFVYQKLVKDSEKQDDPFTAGWTDKGSASN